MFDGQFRQQVERVTGPIGDGLSRTGLSPNQLTACGIALAFVTAAVLSQGAMLAGLFLLIFSALFDALDGALAKAANQSSVRGAFFDSVSDRVADMVVFFGLAWYLAGDPGGRIALLPVAVGALGLMVSYQRSKAESLGLQAKGGLMERAERIIALCVGVAFPVLLIPVLWIMFVLVGFTAVQRFVKVWRQADGPPKRSAVGEPADGGAAATGMGSSDTASVRSRFVLTGSARAQQRAALRAQRRAHRRRP
jgi:CDP-diacylglycerol--glycerol-3-phosphate 3-phosphatidyltransferase